MFYDIVGTKTNINQAGLLFYVHHYLFIFKFWLEDKPNLNIFPGR